MRPGIAGIAGTVLAALLGLLLAAPATAGERTLIVVLDAVPFDTMRRVTDAAGDGPMFDGFAPPIPLISTFPSSTSIALAGILGDLGLAQSPGYEARFFDWTLRRRRGGGLLSYFKVDFPWRSFFDWNRKGPVRNALHAARPIRAGIREIGDAVAAYRASSAETFTIYIADTDTVAHLFGPAALDPILRALDDELRAVEPAHVVVLSDHGLAGGAPLVNVLPAVKERVAAGGWRWSQRLEAPRDVVLTPYGLVSSFEAYTDPSLALEVASALSEVPGVDLCVAPREGGWRAAGLDITLDFDRRGEDLEVEWRWRADGDPQGLLAALPNVRQGTWVADAELLVSTQTTAYPDALHRLASAFSAVENPASVVCSLAPGYMFGARGTERSARWTKGALRWTHGALRRDESYGFLMSNRSLAAEGAAPKAIRFDRALDLALGGDGKRSLNE